METSNHPRSLECPDQGSQEAVSSPSDMHSLLDLVRLRVAQIQECGLGLAYYSFKLKGNQNSSRRLESLESWPVSPVFNGRERAALALAEILGRPLAEESTLLPHLFQQAQGCLTRNEIIRIVVAVEAMQEWQEIENHVQENRA